MSGPFTRDETEQILWGPFYVSPLIVAGQDQGPDLPPKRRVCWNLSKGDCVTGTGSVNSFINKEDFPTCFDMAFRVAEAVSQYSFATFQAWISVMSHLYYLAVDICLLECLFGISAHSDVISVSGYLPVLFIIYFMIFIILRWQLHQALFQALSSTSTSQAVVGGLCWQWSLGWSQPFIQYWLH